MCMSWRALPTSSRRKSSSRGSAACAFFEDVGIKIHKLKHVKLHAKVLLADGERAIVGSINLAPGSFDSRRELAIEVSDEHVVRRVHDVLRHDWENSRPLDLTDKGLLAELEEYDENVVEDLALEGARQKEED